MTRSCKKKLNGTIERQEADWAKFWRSSAGGSTRPSTAGAASAPDARLLFATINAARRSTAEIGAIIVVVSTTIAVAMPAAPPTERQSATVANARLAKGIALATISLESGSPWLAVKKTATSVPWYVVSQVAMTTKVDCKKGCEIAQRNNQQNIFHCIARTQAVSRHSIARRTTMVVFFTSHWDERATTTTFFRLIARERAN